MAEDQVALRLKLDGSDGIKSMKDLKNSIKEAKGDLIAMSMQFGDTSVEARNAAKRVAELEDAIGDAKQLVDQFNPDRKFNAFANSLNGVLGGFSALQGAMGLMGVESEDLQKQLLKVQSALAMSQGINSMLEAKNVFMSFGKTIVDTLGKSGAIGLAIAGVAALGAYIYSLTKETDAATRAQEDMKKAMDEASSSAYGEVARIQELYDITQDANVSLSQRKAASDMLSESVKDLNEKTGEHIELVKDSNGVLEKQPELITRVSNALIQQAQTKAMLGLIEKAYTKVVEAQNATLTSQTNKLEDAAIMTENFMTGFFTGTGRGFLNKGKIQEAAKNKGINDAQAYFDSLKTSFKTGLESGAFKLEIPKSGGGGKGGATTGQAGGLGILEETEKRLKIRAAAEEADRERKQMMDKHMRSRELITNQNNEIVKANVDLNSQLQVVDKARTNIENYNSEQRKKMAEEEAQAKIEAAQSVGNALGALSELFGKQTAAGKALAIAQATINTWVGVTEVLRAKSTLPEPFGTISKIANAAAIVASGISAIKNIVKTQVPGAQGGGATPSMPNMKSETTNAPLSPRLGVTNTQLNQSQLNQLGNATYRTYVIESDMTGSQQRMTRLNRAARLG